MKINFLTAELSGLTGGLLYDEMLFHKLDDYFKGEVCLIDDDHFGNEYDHIKVNYKRFAQIYAAHYEELMDCDYLFINSRLYTRFTKFPWRRCPSKCKVILIHHHFNFMTSSGYHYIAHKYLELSFLKRASKIITPNPYVYDILGKFDLEKKTNLIEAYIENTVYDDTIEKKNDILFVGTIEPRKGVHLGIRAFARFAQTHPEYRYLIAGTIKEQNGYYLQLKKLVESLNMENQIVFLGRIEEEKKVELYKSAKCFLFPSQNEGYGWVLIEAMSYGLPVIAFNNTAMPYTVSKHNGVLVENQNVDEMSTALCKVIDNEELRLKLSEGAKDTVRKLPDDKEIDDEYSHFFELM